MKKRQRSSNRSDPPRADLNSYPQRSSRTAPSPLSNNLFKTDDRESANGPSVAVASLAASNPCVDVGIQSEPQPVDPVLISATKRKPSAAPDAVEKAASFGSNPGSATSPATKRKRIDGAKEMKSFNLKNLKAVAWKANTLAEMSNEELCKVVAAVMINFEENSRPRLQVLAECFMSVFASTSLSGDVFVSFPGAELYDMITMALRTEEGYSNMGPNSTTIFKWRLKRHLQSLRSLKEKN